MRKTFIFLTVFVTSLLLASCGSKSYKVKFDYNYEGSPKAKVVKVNENELVKEETHTRENYKFLGWYLNDALYDFNTEVKSDMTLIAKWEDSTQASNEFHLTGLSTGLIGDYDVLVAKRDNVELNNKDFTWTSSDNDVVSVIEGVVRYLNEGEATITASLNDFEQTLDIVVEKRNATHLMEYFKRTAKDVVVRQTINYVGSDDGSNDSKKNLYPSVVDYRFNDPIVMNERLFVGLKQGQANRPLVSLEWIVVHDTANIDAGAQANHNWIHNVSNNMTSWHYTVGDDGWYKALDDLEVGFQAFDGTDAPAGFTSTGIPATVLRPKMTISQDGYFMILGQKTKIKAPDKDGVITTTADITEAGIWPVIIDGIYHIPDTRYTKSYNSAIVINGGHVSGIGIETSVLKNSDLWITWHRTAKLVAELLIEHDLGFDRVTFHNHFANKPCPRTAMESDNWDNWIALMEFEYHVLKYYSDYEIEFESLTPTILDNTGRIITPVKTNSLAEFKITITSPDGEVVSHTFSSLVNPTN